MKEYVSLDLSTLMHNAEKKYLIISNFWSCLTYNDSYWCIFLYTLYFKFYSASSNNNPLLMQHPTKGEQENRKQAWTIQ
jgi:hypothetical protein